MSTYTVVLKDVVICTTPVSSDAVAAFELRRSVLAATDGVLSLSEDSAPLERCRMGSGGVMSWWQEDHWVEESDGTAGELSFSVDEYMLEEDES